MLQGNKLTAFVPISSADAARTFYRDTLGLPLLYEDPFALTFEIEGILLRATLVQDLHPQPFTILGWQVTDARAIARKMARAGIQLQRFPGMNHDEDGLWKAPGGALVGWFKDPDSNVLSITQLP